MDTSSFWSLSASQILEGCRSTTRGLSESDAIDRLAVGHSSRFRRDRFSSFSILISQFNNPIVLLLFFSALLSYYFEDSTNATIIVVILLLSGILGYWQERSAADAVAKLLAIIETKSTVLRDGREMSIPTEQLVVGDILLLRAGSIVPGDCRILESRSLLVNESALTGESFPIEKGVASVETEAPLGKRTSALFMGTHVVSGTATAILVKAGRDTEFGKISARLDHRPPKTGFELGLKRFGNLLLMITVVLVTIVCIVNIYFDRPVIESLLFGLALAVGMTPQLLPAITSIVLARGAKAMARSEVIVKRLLAIENFGGMDILCLDKTGTLTEGVIELHAATNAKGTPTERILQLASINSHLQSGFENPIDLSIRTACPNLAEGVSKRDELSYDFSRKRISVLVYGNQVSTMITKGALDKILECCRWVRMPDGTVDSIDGERENIKKLFQAWGSDGLRTLGLATRTIESKKLTLADESEMIFEGFLTFTDPPKSSIAETVRDLETLGIRLKVVTGDNLPVALAIAKRVGLPHSCILTGGQIQKLSKEELSQLAVETDIFAEIEPYQKEQIVLAMKRMNHVVGFLGDGINDAPSLHAADVGISVASAVDVSKEAAQVVLLRSDLGVLAKGVREGRRTLANTLKYVFTSISANFGYMLSLALASLFLPFLPLLPGQILLINLLADFPAMALATDSVDPEMLSRPRQWDTLRIARTMLLFGITGTCCDLMTFAVLIKVFDATPDEFRTGWFLVSVVTGLLITFSMRTQRPIYKSRPGSLLIIAAIVVFFIAVTIPFTPIGRSFEFVAPTGMILGMVLAISAIYSTAMETSKYIWFNRQARPGR